jgi:hypothetical protein
MAAAGSVADNVTAIPPMVDPWIAGCGAIVDRHDRPASSCESRARVTSIGLCVNRQTGQFAPKLCQNAATSNTSYTSSKVLFRNPFIRCAHLIPGGVVFGGV